MNSSKNKSNLKRSLWSRAIFYYEMDHKRTDRNVSLCLLAIFLALILSGCADAPYWQHSAQPMVCGEVVRHKTTESVRAACRFARPDWQLHACVAYQGGAAVIHLAPHADDCDLKHELAHCAGWRHDTRPVYRKDCGPV